MFSPAYSHKTALSIQNRREQTIHSRGEKIRFYVKRVMSVIKIDLTSHQTKKVELTAVIIVVVTNIPEGRLYPTSDKDANKPLEVDVWRCTTRGLYEMNKS